MNTEVIGIHPALKPSLATGDPDRHALTFAKVEGNKLIATNGRIIIEVMIESDLGSASLLPASFLKRFEASKGLRGAKIKTIERHGDKLGFTDTKDGAPLTKRAGDASFPPVAPLVDDVYEKPVVASVSLDLALLNKLAKALGASGKSQGVTIEILDGESDPHRGAVRVKVHDCPVPHRAIIMPIHRSE